eukprot:16432643-Heterocapsa_arctica.AAC.1
MATGCSCGSGGGGAGSFSCASPTSHPNQLMAGPPGPRAGGHYRPTPELLVPAGRAEAEDGG